MIIRARRTPVTAPFWRTLAWERFDAPLELRELADGRTSIECSAARAVACLGWAMHDPKWTAEQPLYLTAR